MPIKNTKNGSKSQRKGAQSKTASAQSRSIRLAKSVTNAGLRHWFKQLAAGWELVSDAVSVADPDSDCLLYVNPAWRKLYGYTFAEALDQPISVLTPDGLSDKIRRELLANTRKKGWEGRLLNTDAKGHVFAVDLRTSPLLDEHGELIGLLGVATPVRQANVTDETIQRLIDTHQATLSRELKLLLETALINPDPATVAGSNGHSNGNGSNSHSAANGHGKDKSSGQVPGIGRLSSRELEVFTLIGRGHSTRDISKKLEVSTYTVQTHRNHIKEKLDLPDSAAITYWAFKWAHGQA